MPLNQALAEQFALLYQLNASLSHDRQAAATTTGARHSKICLKPRSTALPSGKFHGMTLPATV